MTSQEIVPRVNMSWDLVVRNVVIDGRRVTGETEDATVTYAMTHNGTAYQSGSLVYGAPTDERANVWSVRFFLPPTPGILVAEITATVENAVGSVRTSLKVEG